MSVKLDPQYGCTLKIGSEVISDEAIIAVNGHYATAYVWNPDTRENEVVGTLEDVNGDGKEGHFTITGKDLVTGENETWTVSPGRPCTSCG
jgi:hypothetical protein